MKTLLTITSLFLWYFVVLFILIVWDLAQGSRLFTQGTLLGNAVARYPYQWDYELMFAGLFLVWGIFLWKASNNLAANKTLITFTAWAFLVHAVTMIIVGIFKTQDLGHMLGDSIPWFALSFLLFYFINKEFGKI